MIWHNDWIWHNLDERIVNKNAKFKFGIVPYKFNLASFKESSFNTAKKIYDEYKQVYVALSGGMDSLYVTKVFHENSIPFIPIIVNSEANQIETQYAFDYCEKNNIKYHLITMTGKDLVRYYFENIYPKIYSVGVNISAAVIAGNYAKENNGILVSGDYLVDVNDDTITCSDYDYFKDLLLGKNINFFSYTPQIAYAMTKECEIPFADTKYRLYGFDQNRAKIMYIYNQSINNVIRTMNLSFPKDKYEHTLMSRCEFLQMMEEHVA